MQTADISIETENISSEEENKQRSQRGKEEEEEAAREKQLEEENAKLDKEIEEEIRGLLFQENSSNYTYMIFRNDRGGESLSIYCAGIFGICRTVI